MARAPTEMLESGQIPAAIINSMSGDGIREAGGVVLATERPAPKITREERLEIEVRNRALLERELLEKRFVFDSRPFEAQIQYSNFCNMSCVMCHDGANPPLRKMSPKILQKVGEQIAPSVSVVIPFDGSEPLIVAWDETRQMAEEYSFELSLTTNAQFLDEQKFFELKDITREMLVSIDTPLPGAVREDPARQQAREGVREPSRARRPSAASTASRSGPTSSS